MKAFYYFSLLAVLLITVCSCKDDNENPTPEQPTFSITMEEENTHPTLSQEGETVTIPFTATGDWTASLMNDRAEGWITISPTFGKAGDALLSISAIANDTYDERNATIVLKCGDDTENIVVTQKQKDAILLSSSKYEVEAKGGEISVEVQANISYEVEVKSDWIKQVDASNTRALSASTLNFTIDTNDTGEKREGEIIIKSGNLSETITVYQGYGDFVALTKRDFTLPEEGGVVDIEIKSTVNYDVKILDNVDWITEIQTCAVSTHTRHYEVSSNESYDSREAKIVFYSLEDETLADTVSIYQIYKGAILVARNEYQFGIQGGNLNLTVSSNLEFDVTVSDEWIRQIGTRGLVDTELNFTITENTEGKEREGIITVKDKNSDKQQIITVKQTATDLEREALIALYKATNGDNWTHNDNWCSDKPVSEWYGISAHTNPTRIMTIDLMNNNLSGTLPDEIKNLKNLITLSLPNNHLIGKIPESICELTSLNTLSLDHNSLTGEIPENIGNLINIDNLQLVGNNLEGNLPESIGDLENLQFFYALGNRLSGDIPKKVLNHPNWKYWNPEQYILEQQSGYKLTIRPEDLYASTDYSKDGEISILQTHTKGNGIKVIIMGDQFVDKDMVSGGLYETKAKETIEHYFSIEPFKSLRDFFDVILIKAVSKNDQMSGETAFSTEWIYDDSFGTYNFTMDRKRCMEYAQTALKDNDLDNIQIIIMQNCYVNNAITYLYANGFSIANCPYTQGEIDGINKIYHEANGHGFGFLHDEYEYPRNGGTIPEDIIQGYQDSYNNNGFYANIDFTNNPQEIKWKHFIVDPRYDNEHIGVYEGAYYRYGVYRATENSVMNSAYILNQFNAPSREAIYKRVMKLAYGDSWTYDYEEFVKFDEQGHIDFVNALNNAQTRSNSNSVSREYKHNPPVIYDYPAVVK